jgi:hypothetical protein
MRYFIVKSGQLNNCPGIYEKFDIYSFTSKEKTLIQENAKHRRKYDARFTHRKVQTVWEVQLPLQRRQQAWADLLPFCQYIEFKDCFDLRIHGKQSNHRRGIRKLSRSTKNYRKNQRHQSRATTTQSNFLKRKLWYLKWIHPP